MLSHNKTLAAQLYGELRQFLPDNAVEYFISYYDYYQPEAYVPSTDSYIEKDASINEDIERAAAARHLEPDGARGRRDRRHGERHLRPRRPGGVPRADGHASKTGEERGRDAHPRRTWSRIQYGRNDVAFEQGTFRVRGDTVEIFPAYEEQAVRIELWGDKVERISQDRSAHRQDHRGARPAAPSIRPSTSSPSAPTIERAVQAIRAELAERLRELRDGGQAAGGAAARVAHQLRHRDDARGRDLRRHRELLAAPHRPRCRASGRPACSTTSPTDFLVVVDESHVVAAADRRHVQRRPRAQDDAGRVRLPPALGARQPPAAVRRVHGARAADDQRLGHAGRARSCSCRAASWSSRSSGRPGWSIPRSRSGR